MSHHIKKLKKRRVEMKGRDGSTGGGQREREGREDCGLCRPIARAF